LASAIEIARVTEPMRPAWLEDPLPPLYSESWAALKRQSRIKILTGEKLEMPKQFLPFIQNETVDIIQPDLAWAGGFTGTRKIADLAWLYQVPMNLHSYASLVLMMASIQFGASVFDFFASETTLGRESRAGQLRIEDMAANKLPEIKNSYVDVPDGPGLGLDLNQEVLKATLRPGEPWWG
jgi:galactonate dehydratase